MAMDEAAATDPSGANAQLGQQVGNATVVPDALKDIEKRLENALAHIKAMQQSTSTTSQELPLPQMLLIALEQMIPELPLPQMLLAVLCESIGRTISAHTDLEQILQKIKDVIIPSGHADATTVVASQSNVTAGVNRDVSASHVFFIVQGQPTNDS